MKDEFLTSNAETFFPFREGQDGIPYWLKRTFVDASIESVTGSASLTHASLEIETGKFTFTVNGKSYETSTAGTAYKAVKADRSCFVVDMDHLATLPTCEFEGLAEFEPSCVIEPPAVIDRISVYNWDDGDRVLEADVTGDFTFKCGYNVDMEVSDDNVMTLSADPGLGLGTVPCDTECTEDPDTDGHPLPTDDGHAVIATDECYEVTARGDTIQLHGKCVACCQCQDYVDIVEDLKKTAAEVVSSKTRLMASSSSYYDLLHVERSPVLDIQIDIAPDAAVSEGAYRHDRSVFGSDGVNYFRVTCVVTNMSGVPCIVAVPDLWNEDEYGTSGVLVIRGKEYGKDSWEFLPSELMSNGIQFNVVSHVNQGSAVIGYTINPDPAEAAGGELLYSRVRGPVLRNEKNTDASYTEPYLKAASGFLTRVNPNGAWGNLAKKAHEDLNAGKNPSHRLKYAEATTDILANGAGGFVMPTGYSFTITNMYAVPTSDISTVAGVGAIARFYAYAPMLLYAQAYNYAVPETKVSQGSSGYEIETTWSGNGAQYVDPMTSLRPQWRSVFLSFDGLNTSIVESIE